MLSIINGDLLEQNFDVIGHQANCLNIMGAGIALQIKNKFPNAFEVDKQVNQNNKYGTFSLSITQRPYIANLYGQYGIGIVKDTIIKEANLKALENALDSLLCYMSYDSLKTLGLPYMIGCGLAGGDWSKTFEMIKKLSKKHDNIDIYLVRKL